MNGPQHLPFPPMELRAIVGPRDDWSFDNPTGRPVYPDLPPEAYRSVFDFGCGCGRIARQLIQQSPRPGRYVGIDAHPGLVAWASANLAPAAPAFTFHHHDVYSPGYAPRNSICLAAPFPMEDGGASLVIAHSVFTHLSQDQTGYYLSEVRRVLAADGVAFTTWFFFDSASTPFFANGPHTLYASEKDFSAAVLYDRAWFLAAVRQVGLMVVRTRPPKLPGFQWEVWLGRRSDNAVDQFPLGAEGSEWLCGATLRARAAVPGWDRLVATARTGSREGQVPPPEAAVTQPPLYGPLAELAAARLEAEALRQSAARAEEYALSLRGDNEVLRASREEAERYARALEAQLRARPAPRKNWLPWGRKSA